MAIGSWWHRLWSLLRSVRGRAVAVGAFLAAAAGTALVTYLLPGGIEALVHRSPVTIVVGANPDRIDYRGSPIGGAYLVSKPIQEIGPSPNNADDCVGRYAWARRLGGVDAEATAVQVVVEGQWTSPVIINGFRPRVVGAAAPLIGSHLICPGRGEVTDIRQLTVELHRSGSPTYEYHAAKDDENKSFAFKLSKGQTELFYITALAMDCDCEWVVDLDLIADGRKMSVTIQDNGRPFRTTASTNARSYRWVQGRWADQSVVPGGAAPAGGVIKAPEHTACDLVTKADAEAVFAQRMSVPSGGGFQESPGAAVDLVTTSMFSSR